VTDTAYETFKVAFERATYLYRLYHGLANRRKRAMRSDWAGNFCDLMHWPKADAHSIDRIDSPDAIVVLRPSSRLTCHDFETEYLSDLLRASLVMGVSSLDAYFHSKTIAYIVRAANHGAKMPKSLKKRTITIEHFVEGKKYERRMNVVRQAMEKSLGFQSLQQPEKIEQAVALIGVNSLWSGVAERCGTTTDILKADLSKIVKRRNQIAHEGDLSQSRKTRNHERSISPKETRDALILIRRIGGRSESEINSQL